MPTDPLQPLRDALAKHRVTEPEFATHVAAAIASAVKDALPGRQQKRNVELILAKAMKAAVRTLRRRAGHWPTGPSA